MVEGTLRGAMEATARLTETIEFEVPPGASARELLTALRRHGSIIVDHGPDFARYSVRLRNDRKLAPLLRAVERWVAEEALRAIRFELDGRAYILTAGEPDWTTAVAA